MDASIEIHLEWAYHAVLPPSRWPLIPPVDGKRVVDELRGRFRSQALSATWYILGDVARDAPQLMVQLMQEGHRLGSHGYWHRHGEQEWDDSDRLTRQWLPECVGYRSPFWDTTPRPGMAGGFFFRTLPYQMLKQQVIRHRVLYLHPHDFYSSHIGPIRRQIVLCDPWERLNRLCHDIDFRT